MTRSVFQMVRFEPEDIFGDDEFLRYGQKVKINVNKYLDGEGISLCSFKQSATVCSPVS